MKFNKNIFLITTLVLALVSQESFAEEWVRILNLKGYWKFSIGDDKKWALHGTLAAWTSTSA